LDTDNVGFRDIDGVLYYYDAKTGELILCSYPRTKTLISYSVYDGTDRIQYNAVGGVDALQSVVIPSSVKEIGGIAFFGCKNLVNVTLSEGLETIKQEAFESCISIKKIEIPASVKTMEFEVFRYCNSLEKAYFYGDAPETFDNEIFHNTTPVFTIYYVAGETGWTTPTWKGYNTEMISTTEVAPSVSISQNNSTPVATITAPEGGWKEGTNTFSVDSDVVCMVIVSLDGGQTYTRLEATVNADGGYSFTAENMTSSTIIAVAVMGDANGDGKLTNADVTRMKAANASKITLSTLENVVGDSNGDGKLTNADVTKLKAVNAGKTTLSWM